MIFLFSKTAQTSSGSHLASYSVGTTRCKAAGAWRWPLTSI